MDGNLTATFVDLMYLSGDELDFVIRIQDSSGDEIECRYSETLERYPWKNFYWAVTTENGKLIQHDNYNDSFYFHEPITLRYWYEETLPPGLKAEMLNLFKKNNPGVVLPATKLLETD